jgi:hypothetical protein
LAIHFHADDESNWGRVIGVKELSHIAVKERR